ncbi:hypothetical protein C7M84_024781, partial [Penaeus vannamei]
RVISSSAGKLRKGRAPGEMERLTDKVRDTVATHMPSKGNSGGQKKKRRKKGGGGGGGGGGKDRSTDPSKHTRLPLSRAPHEPHDPSKKQENQPQARRRNGRWRRAGPPPRRSRSGRGGPTGATLRRLAPGPHARARPTRRMPTRHKPKTTTMVHRPSRARPV